MNKIRRIGRLLLFCTALSIVCALAVDCHVRRAAESFILAPESAAAEARAYDCILVPGCLVTGTIPCAMLRDRLDRAVELYRAGAADRILVSGDHGRPDYDEVNAMKSYLVSKGIPEGRVFMDHAGFSTYETMYRARDVFDVQTPLIVTQTYHLYRAVYDARRLGMTAFGTQSMPNAYTFQTRLDLREILARNKDYVFTLIRPKPTFLGDPTPISGSGSATNDTDMYV